MNKRIEIKSGALGLNLAQWPGLSGETSLPWTSETSDLRVNRKWCAWPSETLGSWTDQKWCAWPNLSWPQAGSMLG
jgi:hypothetical protein